MPSPEKNLKCNKCGKPNHMEKVCQSTNSNSGGGEAKTPPATKDDVKATAGAASTPSQSTEDLLMGGEPGWVSEYGTEYTE